MKNDVDGLLVESVCVLCVQSRQPCFPPITDGFFRIFPKSTLLSTTSS